MRLALRYIWAFYFFFWFLLIFLLFYPVFLLLLRNEKTYATAHKLRAIWGRIIMFFSGLFPRTTYEETLNSKEQYIFVANHFSYLDILSLNVQISTYFRFLAKKELGDIPLFGIFFRTVDIAVNRKSMRDSVTAYQLAEKAVLKGDSLGIFPEGGIANQVPKMIKFKSGAFRLAIEHNVKVVPVTIADNWKRLPQGGFESGGTPGKMRVIVHKPIDTTELTIADLSDLMKEAHETIQKQFDNLNFEPAS
ncbi:MAG: 1-acyl-sn-glycerol-3-phosphate acyltransferase [bacterium]|jgi:1-acyl-sn-glycerol-3-phosphate acyltransferase